MSFAARAGSMVQISKRLLKRFLVNFFMFVVFSVELFECCTEFRNRVSKSIRQACIAGPCNRKGGPERPEFRGMDPTGGCYRTRIFQYRSGVHTACSKRQQEGADKKSFHNDGFG